MLPYHWFSNPSSLERQNEGKIQGPQGAKCYITPAKESELGCPGSCSPVVSIYDCGVSLQHLQLTRFIGLGLGLACASPAGKEANSNRTYWVGTFH